MDKDKIMDPKNTVMGVAIMLLIATSSVGMKEILVSLGFGNAVSFFVSLPFVILILTLFSYNLLRKNKK